MTLEYKIVRDLYKKDKLGDFLFEVLSKEEASDSLEHEGDGVGLINIGKCEICLVKLRSPLLISELNNLLSLDLITKEKYESLFTIISSENPSDVTLVKELIDQFRTKRLRHERINKRRTDKSSKDL